MTAPTGMDLVIARDLDLRAPIDRIWRALTDSAELARWLPTSADLPPGAGADGWFDWAELGRYAVRVEALEPPTRIVWRWAREADTPIDGGQWTTVEWTLTDLGDGWTRLALREWGFVDPAHFRGNSEGWNEELAELRALVEG